MDDVGRYCQSMIEKAREKMDKTSQNGWFILFFSKVV